MWMMNISGAQTIISTQCIPAVIDLKILIPEHALMQSM